MNTPARILILGYAKSGTSVLYSKICNALGPHTVGIFEPSDFPTIQAQLSCAAPLVAKVLVPAGLAYLDSLLQTFSRIILLVRDPRDILVSSLLYSSGYEGLWRQSPTEIADAIAWIEYKQQQPQSLPWLELCRHLRKDFSEATFSGEIRQLSSMFLSLAGIRGLCVCRYEDFITQERSGLEHYLGLSLAGETEVDSSIARVVRTRGSSSWRDWFTPHDVDSLKPLLREYMQQFGYDCQDWTPSATPHIAAQHGADYVQKLLSDRRRQEGLAL